MSIEINKSRYKSITENFVIIDFYRQIKQINWQLSGAIDLSTTFPMIDFERLKCSSFLNLASIDIFLQKSEKM